MTNITDKRRGVLLPISALWGGHGIGSLGQSAHAFCDFLQQAGLTVWQVLPLNPTSYGDSPYQSPSAFAGNPYFIDLSLLAEQDLLTQQEIAEQADGGARVDYGRLYERRLPLLRMAYARFTAQGRSPAFTRFSAENADWLDGYAVFMRLKGETGMRSWQSWPAKYKDSRAAMDLPKSQAQADEEDFWRFLQYQFFTQWQALLAYAHRCGIRIIGDMPIYAALDSADVWQNPQYFRLDKNWTPTAVAGVPPDYFSATGQKWGNPLYDWATLKRDGYRFWVARMRQAMRLYDVVRIDHFRGFAGYYAIPYQSPDATRGKWMQGPGMDLFRTLSAALPRAEIIAEDLGTLDDKVRKLMADTGYPGMRVLQFGFGSDEHDAYLPANYTENCAAYTGTHDNDTLVGWLASQSDEQLQRICAYTDCTKGGDLYLQLISRVLTSRAGYAIVPMQDFLALGSEARMNTPSTGEGNWCWRMTAPPPEGLAAMVQKILRQA